MAGRRHGEGMASRAQRKASVAASAIGLVSVNVGLPQEIGTTRWGKPVRSGIVKQPVTGPHLELDTLNLEGRPSSRPERPRRRRTKRSTPIPRSICRAGTRSSASSSASARSGRISPRRAGWRTRSASATSGLGATRCSRSRSRAHRATSWPPSPAGRICSSASYAAGAPGGTCGCCGRGPCPWPDPSRLSLATRRGSPSSPPIAR